MLTAVSRQCAHDPLASLPRAFRRDRGWLAGCILLAVVVHGIGALTMPRTHRPSTRARDTPLEVIDIDVPSAPPSPVPTPTEPVPLAAQLKPNAPAKEAPAQAAKAGQILSRSDAANDPLDLTGGFINGSAAAYVGGMTTTAGTSRTAVHAVAVAPSAAMPGEKQAGRSLVPDASRRPRMVGGSSWRCPFPVEADGIDQATVDLKVEVDVSGHVRSAAVASDPGRGFGREARRCVLDKQWQPALDQAGGAITGTTMVRVRFTR
jgi:periplasmic protein TonB